MNIKHRTTCRICGNTNLTEIIDLGSQYLQGSFIKPDRPLVSYRKIPNKIIRCNTKDNENACGLVQTAHTIPPEIMYSNYWYESGISSTMRSHLHSIVNKAIEFVPEPKMVLDIAMNDGTLLQNYPPNQNIQFYGVDPSDITRKNIDKLKNITVINELFPSTTLEKVICDKKFDIITSIACFYDLDDPKTFCKSINNILSDDGIWIFEMAYLPFIIENLCYDTFCSEHLEHYHLAPIEHLLKECGLKLVYAETNSINGGSICCYATKIHSQQHNTIDRELSLIKLRIAEFDLCLDENDIYLNFEKRVSVQKLELLKFFDEQIISKNKTVHLYGASTKINTLLGYCFGDSIVKYIQYASERSPEKYGAKTLSGIQILSEEESRNMKPDYYLVGPWHFKQEILEREKNTINSGVSFIFPLPKLEIVS
jgi:hypothetical protein